MLHATPSGGIFMPEPNPEQAAAVEATEGPVLILAGAGTGETRTPTARMARIHAEGPAGHARSWPPP